MLIETERKNAAMMDFTNAAFNAVAAAFVIINALDILERRDVAGHTYPSTIFFAIWSAFSILYFTGLQQWWSVAASVAMFVANAYLLALVFRFRKASQIRA